MLTVDRLDLQQLNQQSGLWNDLWERSPSRLPTQRVEGIGLWRQTFAPDAELVALVVRQDDRWLAALPLIKQRGGSWVERFAGHWLTTYRLPNNETVRSGDLLIDPSADFEASIRLIASELGALGATLVMLDQIDMQAPRWRMLVQQMQREGHEMHLSAGHQVGVVDILHDWDAYTRSWSRNHRSALKRTKKKFEAQGAVEVDRLREPSDKQLGEGLDACFEIEDRGWKGDQGSSVLKTPGLRDYYFREAQQVRDAGMLDLWLLKLDGQIVAFEYCHLAKSTCFSHKISFDPAWDRFSPGRLLRYYQLEQYHRDRSVGELDTLGVLCQAKAKWTTRTYTCGRILVATGGRCSNCLLRLAKSCRKLYRGLRRVPAGAELIEPGAARYLELTTPTTEPALPPKVGFELEVTSGLEVASGVK